MNWLRIGVAIVITTIWATGYVLAYAGLAKAAPTELTPLMLGVVGFLLTTEARKVLQKTTRREDDDESI